MLEKWDLNVSGGGGGGGGREEKIEKLKNHRKISFLGDSFFKKKDCSCLWGSVEKAHLRAFVMG